MRVWSALVFLCAALVGTQAAAFPVSGIQLYIHRGNQLNVNHGVNNLDAPITFYCQSSQCTVTITTMVQTVPYSGFYVCALVDGIRAAPLCPNQPASFGTTLQDWLVGAGQHTAQTTIKVDNPEVVATWEVKYEIYAH
jgi:hypothetical protein